MIEYVIMALSLYTNPIKTITSYIIYNKIVYGKILF